MPRRKHICKQVRANIDPIFGTTLSTKFKSLYDQVCEGDLVELCKAFRSSPTKNPITNRAIKEDSHIFAFFTLLSSHVLDNNRRHDDDADADVDADVYDANDSHHNNHSNTDLVITNNNNAKLVEENKHLEAKLDDVTRRLKRIEDAHAHIEAKLEKGMFDKLEAKQVDMTGKFVKFENTINKQHDDLSKHAELLHNLDGLHRLVTKNTESLNDMHEIRDLQDRLTKVVTKNTESLHDLISQVATIKASTTATINELEDHLVSYMDDYNAYNKLIFDQKSSIFSRDKIKHIKAPHYIKREHKREEARKKKQDEDEHMKKQEEIKRKQQEESDIRASVLKTIESLKDFYMTSLQHQISDSTKKANRAFLLLAFHPDKLPRAIKEDIAKDQALGDNSSSLFASRVFATVNTHASLTESELEQVLKNTKYSGGKAVVKKRCPRKSA